MSKYKVYFLAAALIVLGFAAYSVNQDSGISVSAISVSSGNDQTSAKRDLLALKMAYPDDITAIEKDGQTVYVVMSSGEKIVYDDQKAKSFEEKLGNADIQDTMEIVYPLQSIDTLMSGNADAGRIRCYALLKAVYGGSQSEVEESLKSVDTGAGGCPFNAKNGAAQALTAAFSDVSALIKSDESIYSFVYPLSGTFNYRVIAGTGQLSPHAFAIAIDLCRDSRDYWQWASREQGQSRLDEYPRALVGVFESHGFIWGGKWAHFDFLHFEYRPELIIKAQCEAEPVSSWHDGFPDTEDVQGYVKMIEDAWK
jgi:hypothetical protein